MDALDTACTRLDAAIHAARATTHGWFAALPTPVGAWAGWLCAPGRPPGLELSAPQAAYTAHHAVALHAIRAHLRACAHELHAATTALAEAMAGLPVFGPDARPGHLVVRLYTPRSTTPIQARLLSATTPYAFTSPRPGPQWEKDWWTYDGAQLRAFLRRLAALDPGQAGPHDSLQGLPRWAALHEDRLLTVQATGPEEALLYAAATRHLPIITAGRASHISGPRHPSRAFICAPSTG